MNTFTVFTRPLPVQRGIWIVRQAEPGGSLTGWSAGGSRTWVTKPRDLRSIERDINTGSLVRHPEEDRVLAMAREWELEGV